MLRAIRRCAQMYPLLASEICEFAEKNLGKTVYAPGGALKNIFMKLGGRSWPLTS